MQKHVSRFRIRREKAQLNVGRWRPDDGGRCLLGVSSCHGTEGKAERLSLCEGACTIPV